MRRSPIRDLVVGCFVLIGLAAIAYLSLSVGGVAYKGPTGLRISADFDEIGGLKPFKMPDLVKQNLQNAPNAKAEVDFSPGRKPMRVIDTPLTMVAPKGAVAKLEKEEDVKDAMICEGCAE